MLNAFANLLGVVLVASVAYFVVMGLRQWRRTRRMVCRADAMGFHFGPEDLFDMPTRFGDFALFGIGHSSRAHNVRCAAEHDVGCVEVAHQANLPPTGIS